MHERMALMDEVDADEKKLCEVGKHPFGIIVLYIQAFIGIIGGLGFLFFLIPLTFFGLASQVYDRFQFVGSDGPA